MQSNSETTAILQYYLHKSLNGRSASLEISAISDWKFLIGRWPILRYLLGREFNLGFLREPSRICLDLETNAGGAGVAISQYVLREWKRILVSVPLCILGDIVAQRRRDSLLEKLWGRASVQTELDPEWVISLSRSYQKIRIFGNDGKDFVQMLGKRLGLEAIAGKAGSHILQTAFFPFKCTLFSNQIVNIWLGVVNVDSDEFDLHEIVRQLADEVDIVVHLVLVGSFHGAISLCKDKIRLPNVLVSDINEIKNFLFNDETTTTVMYRDWIVASLAPVYVNPYKTDGAVSKEMFFGRRKQLITVSSRVDLNFAILGSRKAGKTSFLNRLYERLSAQDQGNVLLLDCTHIRSYSQFLKSLAQELASSMGDHFDIDWYRDEVRFLEEFPKGLERAGLEPVVLIDEIDLLLRESHKLLHGFIRSMANMRRMRFIISGYIHLHEALDDRQSTFYNLFEVLSLGNLENQEARELVVQPLERIKVRLERPGLVDKIIERGSRLPYLLQALCRLIIENLVERDQRVVTEQLVEDVYFGRAYSDILVGGLRGDRDLTARQSLCLYILAKINREWVHEEELYRQMTNEVEFTDGILGFRSMISYLERTYKIQISERRQICFFVPGLGQRILELEPSLDFVIRSLAATCKKTGA